MTVHDTPTLQDLRLDPDLLGVLKARAHRARSEAIANSFVRLFGGLKARAAQLVSGNAEGRLA